MRLSIAGLLSGIILIFAFNTAAFAAVDFTITPNAAVLGPLMDFTDVTDSENKIKENPDKLLNNNDEVIPYGLVLANTFGYPNGKAIIPNYEGGFAIGASVYKYDRYKDFNIDDPEVPGGGANAAIHFGFGVSEETDVTFKLFINQGIYEPDNDIKKESDTRKYDLKLKNANLLSLGFKGRYNIVGKREFVPYVFSFGGVTAGVAVDYMHGKVSSNGTYTDLRSIAFSGTEPLSGDPFDQNVDIETTVNGKAVFEWNMISATPEIMGYVDLFYLFSLYTGPALTLNAGSANISMNAKGVLKNMTPVYSDSAHIVELAAAGNTIATGDFTANAPLYVPVAVPLWKAGLELNFAAFKITVEGATVLTSIFKSFTAQAGMRVQF